MTNIPGVLIGCELLVRVHNSVLLGLRAGSFGTGTWGLPGGHLEPGEFLTAAAARELLEETGISVTPDELRFVSLVDDLQPKAAVHYLHVTFEASFDRAHPHLLEPGRCQEWKFFDLDDLPDEIFSPHQPIIQNYRKSQLFQQHSSEVPD